MVNNPPLVSSYTSDASETYRTDSVILFVDVSDVEDSDDNLTIDLQHRAPQGTWSDAYLSTVWFNSSSERWQANFTPTTVAVLGDYDIRVKVSDTDNGASSWSTYNNNITVLNNAPIFQNYVTGADEVLRTSTIVIGVNSTDIEDLETTHTIEF